MHFITLDSETDFDGWRKAARVLALNNVKPSDVSWRVAGDALELFEPTAPPLDPSNGTFNVPAKFVELAEVAILHRNPERFALLYRLLWQLRTRHDLLDIATDPDARRLCTLGRPCRLDHAGRSQERSPDPRPAGGNLAALLRQHLQPRPAEGEGDAGGNAEEVPAEPAGGFVD